MTESFFKNRRGPLVFTCGPNAKVGFRNYIEGCPGQEDKENKCPRCEGTGKLAGTYTLRSGVQIPVDFLCPACKGTGLKWRHPNLIP